MAEFAPNPPPGPRLYLIIHPSTSGAGNPATGGIVQAAVDNFSSFVRNDYGADEWLNLGGGGKGLYGLINFWSRGWSTTPHRIGFTSSTYPTPNDPILCTPHNHLTHTAEMGDTSYTDQIVPALDPLKPQIYDIVDYQGGLHDNAATDDATLDACTAIIRALKGTPSFDAGAVLDYNADTPHKRQVLRLQNTHGLRIIDETWEYRGDPAIRGWFDHHQGALALSSTSNPLDTATRPGLALLEPWHWHNPASLTSLRKRPVIFTQDNPDPPENKIRTALFWRSKGCDVWLGGLGFSLRHKKEILAAFRPRLERSRPRSAVSLYFRR